MADGRDTADSRRALPARRLAKDKAAQPRFLLSALRHRILTSSAAPFLPWPRGCFPGQSVASNGS